jgi:hypothetical protein
MLLSQVEGHKILTHKFIISSQISCNVFLLKIISVSHIFILILATFFSTNMCFSAYYRYSTLFYVEVEVEETLKYDWYSSYCTRTTSYNILILARAFFLQIYSIVEREKGDCTTYFEVRVQYVQVTNYEYQVTSYYSTLYSRTREKEIVLRTSTDRTSNKLRYSLLLHYGTVTLLEYQVTSYSI